VSTYLKIAAPMSLSFLVPFFDAEDDEPEELELEELFPRPDFSIL
jgi:hypothetical protein